METFKIGICEPEDFSQNAIRKLQSIGTVELFNDGNLQEFISDKNVIFIRLKYAIDEYLIRNASCLKYICSPTTGLNHIKISSDRVKVLSLKGEYKFLDSIRATPEHIFGLTLALLRNYSHAFLSVHNRKFDRNPYKGYELFGNTVGIIGFGRVGKLIAKYYKAFDAEVCFYDIQEKITDDAIRCESIEDLIERANIIILAANYTKENEKMISEKHFEYMQNKYFINAARGELVDEQSLLEYIKKNWFRGVAIDVISNETNDSVFLSNILSLVESRNLIITPHIGGATYSSMEKTEEFIVKKLVDEIRREGR
jgi:D-3-phosphoglycerate dehydrogenase